MHQCREAETHSSGTAISIARQAAFAGMQAGPAGNAAAGKA